MLSLGSLPFGSVVGSKYTLEVNSEERRQVEALTQLSGMLSIDAEESLSAFSLELLPSHARSHCPHGGRGNPSLTGEA